MFSAAGSSKSNAPLYAGFLCGSPHTITTAQSQDGTCYFGNDCTPGGVSFHGKQCMPVWCEAPTSKIQIKVQEHWGSGGTYTGQFKADALNPSVWIADAETGIQQYGFRTPAPTHCGRVSPPLVRY